MFKLPPKEEFLKKPGMYDHQSHLYFEAIKHCKKFRNAIDVGAHVGFFSSKMINDFDNVYAFEPMFYDCLRENVKADNFTLYEYGVSDKKTSYNFNIRHHHTGMSKIDSNGKDKINCVDIDSYDFENVDLIKIDTEDHEQYVINGMTKFFENNHPVIIIELNKRSTRQPILDKLETYDYTVVMISATDYILK